MKAAALMDFLINNHPFVDGNKRTGITAAVLFLRINGRKLSAPSKDLEAVTLSVATKDMQIAELATWLQENSAATKNE
jgi:death-on-curing protein